MPETVIGIFNDWDAAQVAAERLHAEGFPRESISLLSATTGPTTQTTAENVGRPGRAEEGAMMGAATGGALGAAEGLALGLSALAIPGLGPIIAAGPILGAIAGLAAGAGAGGLLGWLIGAGMPESEARLYEHHIGQGNIVVSVIGAGNESRAESVLQAAGAVETHLSPADTTGAYEETRARMAEESDAVPGEIGWHEQTLDDGRRGAEMAAAHTGTAATTAERIDARAVDSPVDRRDHPLLNPGGATPGAIRNDVVTVGDADPTTEERLEHGDVPADLAYPSGMP